MRLHHTSTEMTASKRLMLGGDSLSNSNALMAGVWERGVHFGKLCSNYC